MFDQMERAVGNPLETMANTREFATVMAVGTRLKRQFDEASEEMFAKAVHRFGLPARQDVTEMARAVARVERRLQQLSHELEMAREEEHQVHARGDTNEDGEAAT
jgi:hypothetical protein